MVVKQSPRMNCYYFIERRARDFLNFSEWAERALNEWQIRKNCIKVVFTLTINIPPRLYLLNCYYFIERRARDFLNFSEWAERALNEWQIRKNCIQLVTGLQVVAT